MKRLLLAFLLLLGGFVLIFISKDALVLAHKSKNWNPTDGVVSKSIFYALSDNIKSKHSVYYLLELVYGYEVLGKKYYASRISFAPAGNSRLDASLLAMQYSEGREVVVFYDPSEPSSAVLEPGIQSSMIFMPFVGVLLVLSAGFLFVATSFSKINILKMRKMKPRSIIGYKDLDGDLLGDVPFSRRELI